MQLETKHLKPEDAQRLDLVENVPTGKDLWDAEQEYWANPTEENYFKYLRLRKIEYAWTLYRPRDVAIRNELHDRDYLMTTVSQAIWGMENKPVYIEYPETWWDAFKNRWFPEWLLRYYPTNWIEWYIDSKTLYPLLEIESPNYTHTIVYHDFREETSHRNKSEAGLKYECPYYFASQTRWYTGIVQFIKDCIPK